MSPSVTTSRAPCQRPPSQLRRALIVALLTTACGGGADAPVGLRSVAAPDRSSMSQAPFARIDLKSETSTLAHASTRPWLLSNSGTVDAVASTVTWSINATQGAPGARLLVITGSVIVRNTGGVAAPIGNVVVRLQSRDGPTWTTRSADVANATIGDAATSVQVVSGNSVATISENGASGSLSVPISPQVDVGANATVRLNFTAAFNNDVLAIAVGTTVRAEVLVTFGNAGPGNGPTNVDINGNGVNDTNEERVAGVSALFDDELVPAASLVTTPVTLSETAADITTTGTATFSNPVFTIGQTSGTVQVTYDGGTEGGTIRNCAHLTGTGINIETCSTQIVAAEPFEWADGDVVTFRQVDWGDATILETPTPFSTVYPLGLRVGTLGVPNQFSILLSSGTTTLAYLPTLGANVALTQSYVDPVISAGGLFGGQLVALRLNVDFGAAGLIGGTFDLGDLYLCGLTTPAAVNGSTVSDFVTIANTVLAGGSVSGVSIDDASQLAALINSAFLGGVPSGFADTNLSPNSCP